MPSPLLVVVGISERLLLGIAEFVSDRVEALSTDIDVAALNHFPILDPQAPDLGELPVIGAVAGDELRNHGKGAGRIDGKVGVRAKESLVAQSVWVEIAAVFVADSSVPLTRGIVSTLGSVASGLPLDGADVRRVCSRDAVGFPDVHLGAASAVASCSTVLVSWAWLPVFTVAFAVYKLEVVGALSIAISRTVLRSSLIARIFAHPTIGIHLHEVEGTVQSTWQLRDVHIEGEFSVLEFEDFVLALRVQEVES